MESSSIAPANALSAARKSAGDALQGLAVVEAQRIQALGGAATGEELLKQKTDALTGAMLQGKMSAEDYNRALHGDTDNQVSALRDQLGVVQAITESERLSAQYAADYNAQKRAGKTDEDASAIASSKEAVNKAAAAKSGDQMVQASEDNLALVQAAGTADEARIKSDIAYRDAIKGGANAAQAAVISVNTLMAETIKAAQAAQQMADAYQAAADALVTPAGSQDNLAFGDKLSKPSTSSQYGTIVGDAQTSTSNLGMFILSAYNMTQSATDIISSSLSVGVDAAIAKLKGVTGLDQSSTYFSQFGLASKGTQSDITSAIMSLYDLKTTQAGNDSAAKAANYKDEIAFLRSQPETIAGDQQIANLMQSINSLTGATNSNTSALDALSPFYTQDPRTSHIGFRSQGMATGGEFTVPGGYSTNDNMLASILVASGEIVSVRRPGQDVSGGSSQTISVTNHITISGNASKDEVGRTLYQAGQSMARQLAAASR